MGAKERLSKTHLEKEIIKLLKLMEKTNATDPKYKTILGELTELTNIYNKLYPSQTLKDFQGLIYGAVALGTTIGFEVIGSLFWHGDHSKWLPKPSFKWN